MPRPSPKIFLLPVLLALLLLPAPPPGAQDERVELTERELAEVRERIERLREDIEKETRRRDRLGAELGRIEAEMGAARRRLAGLGRERAAADRRLAEIAAEERAAAATLEREREQLAAQLRAAYASGRQERIKLVLNQRDPATLGRMLVYYRYLNAVRGRNIETVTGELARLAALEREARETRERLAALEAEAAREHAALAAARDERAAVLAAIETDLARRGDEVAKLERQQRQLVELLAELSSILADYPITAEAPFSSYRGKLTWPVAGRVLNRFGEPRGGGGLKWNGVLVGAPQGREVRAVYHGRVAYADWLPGLGLLVVVDHGEGYMSLYGHNDSLLKSAGDWVAPGDVVATVGESGGRAEPALYFEIRRGTKPVDPQRWMGKRPRDG